MGRIVRPDVDFLTLLSATCFYAFAVLAGAVLAAFGPSLSAGRTGLRYVPVSDQRERENYSDLSGTTAKLWKIALTSRIVTL